jgi:hypothetical protein
MIAPPQTGEPMLGDGDQIRDAPQENRSFQMNRSTKQSAGMLAWGMALITAAAATGALAWAPQALADPDLSSPKAAALSFAVALEKGDTEGAKAAAVATAKNAEMIGLLTEVGQNANKLRDAAKAKFGDAAAEQFGTAKHTPEEVAKQLDKADIKIDADTATITNPNPDPRQRGSLTLKKVNNDWRVDLTSGPMGEQLIQQLPVLQALSSSFSDVAAEIAADKYKTVEEAKQAIQARMMSVVLRRQGASSAPSTQPG